MDGCTTLDTLTTVCTSTPPLPAIGGTGWGLAVAVGLVALGALLVWWGR